MIDYDSLPACPVQTCLNFISDKWKILIIRDLLDGTKRFNELKKSLAPITQKMLTQQLREMEQDDLIHREVSVYAIVRTEAVRLYGKYQNLYQVGKLPHIGDFELNIQF